jgi:hypothetical protein
MQQASSKQASTQAASKQASKHASKQASKQASINQAANSNNKPAKYISMRAASKPSTKPKPAEGHEEYNCHIARQAQTVWIYVTKKP